MNSGVAFIGSSGKCISCVLNRNSTEFAAWGRAGTHKRPDQRAGDSSGTRER